MKKKKKRRRKEAKAWVVLLAGALAGKHFDPLGLADNAITQLRVRQ